MKKTFVYDGSTPLIPDGPIKNSIEWENSVFPPRFIMDIGERTLKRNGEPIPIEELKDKSFIIEDVDGTQLEKYIKAGNCVTHHVMRYSLDTNDEFSILRYSIPYKDPNASCFKATTEEPIFDATNVQTDAKCELHCISTDDTDYVRDVVLPVKTAGTGALNIFDIIGDIEDDIEAMAEDEVNGFYFNELGELTVPFFHKETGEMSEASFDKVDDFLQTVVSIRLVDVENHIRNKNDLNATSDTEKNHYAADLAQELLDFIQVYDLYEEFGYEDETVTDEEVMKHLEQKILNEDSRRVILVQLRDCQNCNYGDDEDLEQAVKKLAGKLKEFAH